MSDIPFDSFTCRICKNEKENIPYTAREMMYGLREEFQYFECSNCGCVQIADFPNDMSAYYPGDYYSFSPYDGKKYQGFIGKLKRWQVLNSILGSNFFKRFFGKKEFKIFDNLKVTKATRIMDVGCGNGRNFLYPLAEAGFKNIVGCDPYLTSPIDYSNGLKIENKDIQTMENEWDIITYHHAFEHLEFPFQNLNKVHQLLADDGVCIIRIPTVSSYAWPHYGTDWVQFDAPRHFFLHSLESMNILADKEGLKVTKVVYDSNHFQFTGSEKYKLDIPLSQPKDRRLLPSVKRKLNERSFNRKAKRLNLEGRGDQAAFFLRKK